MYYGLLINALYAYLIIKTPAPLVLSVNNRDTVLVRANIIHGQKGVREKVFNGKWVLVREGGKYHLPTLLRILDS